MNFPFAVDSEAQVFCESIAHKMASQFQIPIQEAEHRINNQWKHVQIGGSQEIIYHEAEDFWASDIYFGHDSFWWITGDARIEKALPPLKPKPLN